MPDGPTESLTPREAVVRSFRERENEALRRHTAIVGADGMGSIYIECGCERRWAIDGWVKHIDNVIAQARKPKPQQRK